MNTTFDLCIRYISEVYITIASRHVQLYVYVVIPVPAVKIQVELMVYYQYVHVYQLHCTVESVESSDKDHSSQSSSEQSEHPETHECKLLNEDRSNIHRSSLYVLLTVMSQCRWAFYHNLPIISVLGTYPVYCGLTVCKFEVGRADCVGVAKTEYARCMHAGLSVCTSRDYRKVHEKRCPKYMISVSLNKVMDQDSLHHRCLYKCPPRFHHDVFKIHQDFLRLPCSYILVLKKLLMSACYNYCLGTAYRVQLTWMQLTREWMLSI